MNYKLCITYLLLLSACSEQLDTPVVQQQEEVEQNAVTFTHSVAASQQATRANETLINKGVTSLDKGMHVGIFGCYTGQNKWEDLVKLSQKANPTSVETQTLNDYYTANQMYNVQATVGDGGTLTYTPQQFWPNNALTSDATQHEYMTFWAYYPYNPTSTMGTYGIAITETTTGKGVGMGQVNFTMHPDASQQNDFLISAPVTDCNRDKYPLQRTANPATYEPKPVPFRLYHMLAQVRIYAYIRGDDKMVYEKDGKGNDKVVDDTWFSTWAVDGTIMDAWGNVYTKKGADQVVQTTRKAGLTDAQITEYGCGDLTKEQFLARGLKVPDETQCVRWERTGVWDLNHARRRAKINYSMEFNNVKTSASFYPVYDSDGKNATIGHTPATSLGSATVNHYVMNPYWFTFQDNKLTFQDYKRVRLNDNYMFGYYEDTPVAKKFNATDAATLKADTDAASLAAYDDYDGVNWSGKDDPLGYLSSKTEDEKKEIAGRGDYSGKHYNYASGNILLMVPQTLNDDDVPNVVITAKGKRTVWNSSESKWEDEDLTAKVTVNMLKMGISWQSGFIYCYAFLDDLRPGDDKVRGPESITVLFNSNWYTDQW